VLLERFLGEVGVLEILEMLQDGLSGVERLGATRPAGQGVETRLDLGRES
jgi:hypothetical protein